MKIRSIISGHAPLVLAPLMVAALTGAAASQPSLVFPENAIQKFEDQNRTSSYQLPLGPFQNGTIPSENAEGHVIRQVWRTLDPVSGTLGLLKPLRDQLTEAGYEVLFECNTIDCGGFDFRFQTEVVPEPDMHVDLGDFRFLSAKKTDGDVSEFIGLLISRSAEQGFVQVTSVGDPGSIVEDVAFSTKQTSTDVASTPTADVTSLSGILSQTGSAVLEGLTFANGKSSLGDGDDRSLQDLVAFLSDNPARSVVLVGHTDASGSLKGNVALSRKRAESVVRRLVDTYGIDPERLSSQGIGYLSPRASNSTEEGRDKNRRVEVVLTLE